MATINTERTLACVHSPEPDHHVRSRDVQARWWCNFHKAHQPMSQWQTAVVFPPAYNGSDGHCWAPPPGRP